MIVGQAPTPTFTPCPTLTNATIGAKPVVGAGGYNVSWSSTGGCGAVTGTITAQYSGEPAPYATYKVGSQSGTIFDRPPVRCSTVTVVYTLTLRDSSGQVVSTTTSISFTPLC